MTMEAISQVHQRHTVMVDDGSGVLIQPKTDQYSYILTARHNLLITPTNLEDGYKNPDDIEITDINEQKINVLEIFAHSDSEIDLAIILVELQEGLSINLALGTLPEEPYKFRLAGFPDTRRGNDNVIDKYSSYILEPVDEIQHKTICSVTDFVDYGNVVGFSGGGVFVFSDNAKHNYLAMIETQMDGDPDIEVHGRLQCTKVKHFRDIIKENSYQGNPLEEILPNHLNSFESFVDLIFYLIDLSDWWDDEKLEEIISYLKTITRSEIISVNIRPIDLIDAFINKFNDDGTLTNEILDVNLWVSLLEILVLSVLIDNPEEINIDYIECVLNKRRLVYFDSPRTWKAHIKEILIRKHNDIADNGILLVKTNKASNEVVQTVEQLKQQRKQVDIFKGISDPSSIANAQRNLTSDLSLVDVLAMHNICISSKENEYPDIDIIDNNQELRGKIINEYSRYLGSEAE